MYQYLWGTALKQGEQLDETGFYGFCGVDGDYIRTIFTGIGG
jgi:hypothetical protein